jgi:predicted RNase H-like HicB family nuclease
MTHLNYTVILEHQAEGEFYVSCPVLPGCHSEGDTLDEALVNIKEAVEAYVESLKKHGEAIPMDEGYRRVRAI